ncbi:hypothetical protein AB1Y20_014143 [Prymnesium parvum]|uniref:PARP n=1 Tax=Prymnesium parvum TaxID=97485 RepID=A0AB34IDG0_PRYPA
MLRAAENGDVRELTRLLRNNANIEERDDVRVCVCGWRRERVSMDAALTSLKTRPPPHLSSPRRQACFSPLHWAARNGHEGAVRLLLENNADIAARDNGGYSPLHWAASNGHEGAVRLLLENNADIAARANAGSSPLHWAAFKGHDAVVRLLLENNADTIARENVRVCTCGWRRVSVAMGAALTLIPPLLSSPRRQGGKSPLHLAAMNGHEGAVRLLLENSGDIAARDNVRVCACGWRRGRVGMGVALTPLAPAPCLSAPRRQVGFSPLHFAASKGHEGAVRLLLENNADTAAGDNVRVCACGWRRERVAIGAALTPLTPAPCLSSPRRQVGASPLYWAASNGHEGAVRLLLEKNADIAATNNAGLSPLHWAASKGHEVIVRLLLENNADIAASTNVGFSPLHWAAMNGHDGTVRLLLEKNADISARDNVRVCACGWRRERVTMGVALTPLTLRLLSISSPRRQAGFSSLHWTASKGHEGAVRLLLLENNVDIAARDNAGFSPLHWAAGNGHEGAVRLLLENNADIAARDNAGFSPLHFAAGNGHEGAVRLLLENNADIAASTNVRVCVCGWRRERVAMGAALTPVTPRLLSISFPRRQAGFSPLHWTASKGHEGIVRLLLEKNADIAARDHAGYSPLHCAASNGNEGAVRLLLENNADIAASTNVRVCACGWRRERVAMGAALTPLKTRPPPHLSSTRRQEGYTPLHCAAHKGHENAVRLLLEKNADIAARNNVRVCACGWRRESVAMGAALTPLTPHLPSPALASPLRQGGLSPLHCAAYNGHEGAVRLLLENNADFAARENLGYSPLNLAARNGHEGVVRLLLENNADIAARENGGDSPLHWAAKNGHEGVVRLLLENNADIAARANAGFSPLHWAAKNGHEGAVRLLLQNNADIAARTNAGKSTLHSAASKGHEGAVGLLLENNADTAARDDAGFSPLHWAAGNGHEGAVRLLLEKNADIAARDNAGKSPLHLAATKGHEGAVRLLLEKNADIAASTIEGFSSLHLAAINGHEGAVRLLLEKNGDIAASTNVRVCACGWRLERVAMGAALTPLTLIPLLFSSSRRQAGKSPLHLSAFKGHEGVVRLLLENHADTAARDNEGYTPLHCAAHKGHENAVRLLLEKNADIAARNNVRVCVCGWRRESVAMGAALTPLTPHLPSPALASPLRQGGLSPLHCAAYNGHEGAVRLLLENNADFAARENVRVCACGWSRERVAMGAALTALTPPTPSSPRRQLGYSPLNLAARNGHEGVVRLLLENNADIAARENGGDSPLHWAAKNGHEGVVRLLLENNADIAASTNAGKSPLHYAARNGHEGAVRLLLENNADIAASTNAGLSPLHLAASKGHEGAVRLLLENNADIAARANDGSSPLHCAVKNGDGGTVRLLLEKNADIAARDNDGDSPLHHAASHGHEGVVRLLLENNADIAARDNVRVCACGWRHERVAATPRPPPPRLSSPRRQAGFSPLHLVADNGHEGAMRLLLENNADIAARTNDNFSPLHHAAHKGHESAVRVLLENNADTAARDNDGFSPFHLASMNDHEGAARLLLLENNANTGARDDVRVCACGWRRVVTTKGDELGRRTGIGLLLMHEHQHCGVNLHSR